MRQEVACIDCRCLSVASLRAVGAGQRSISNDMLCPDVHLPLSIPDKESRIIPCVYVHITNHTYHVGGVIPPDSITCVFLVPISVSCAVSVVELRLPQIFLANLVGQLYISSSLPMIQLYGQHRGS